MSKCSRCGTYYSDSAYRCPTCETQELMKENSETQERLAKEQERRLWADREEQRRIAEKAAEEHRRITSTAWQLEAQKKAEQAFNLLESGLSEEALKLSLDAATQDPSCISAYICAINALADLGRAEEASKNLSKAIKLLQTEDHKNSLNQHNMIFLCLHRLGKPQELLQRYKDVLNNNSMTWKLANIQELQPLITELLNNSETESARSMINNLIQKAANTPFSVMLPILAYDLEIDRRLGVTMGGAKIEEYLQTIDRNINVDNLQKLKGIIAQIKSNEDISEAVFNHIKNMVVERSEKVWKALIAGQIAESIKSGRIRSESLRNSDGLLASSWVIGFFFLYYFGMTIGESFVIGGLIMVLLRFVLYRFVLYMETAKLNKEAHEVSNKVLAQKFDDLEQSASKYDDAFSADQIESFIKSIKEKTGQDISQLVRNGERINAIKCVREATGWGLEEAKEFVERLG